MAKIETPMTPQQVENNYEYKVVKRALMREYSWIKDVTFNPQELDEYNLIFLNLTVDPKKIEELYGWEMASWVNKAYNNGERYGTPYISLLFKISYDEGQQTVSDPLNKMFEDIHKSPALPEDMRLPKGRRFNVGSYIINPSGGGNLEDDFKIPF
jgi:hypothetical protein